MVRSDIQNVLDLLNKGEIFAAYDKAKALLKTSLSAQEEIQIRCCIARALLHTGSYNEAHQKIAPLIDNNFADIKTWVTFSEDALKNHIQSAQSENSFSKYSANDLSEIGKIYKEIFYCGLDINPKQSLEHLLISRCFLLASYKANPSSSIAAEAACLSWISGDKELWRILADYVVNTSIEYEGENNEEHIFTFYQAKGYAFLLQGKMQQAKDVFEKACLSIEKSFSLMVNLRLQLRMLHRAGLVITADIFDILKPPVVVIFTGHSLDAYGTVPLVFPAFLENIVKQSIVEKLNSLKVSIGYTSASCGADIIFAETLIEQNKELNLILPFDLEDFIEQHVRLGGAAWERRFRILLTKASSIIYATEENFLNHLMLYRFSNKILHGAAESRCQYLETSPHLLALWNHQNDSLPGGAGDFINQWGNIQTLHLIDLEELLTPYKEQSEMALVASFKNMSDALQERKSKPSDNAATPRVIKCMLFSDFSGFSKLSDKYIPHFLEFMKTLSYHLKQLPFQPESLNTWGDAFFIIMDSPQQLARYALQLNDLVKKFGRDHFPVPLQARISLDVGPVFQIEDPFSQKSNFFGGHINRAARLEPVTVVGQVFATQQFVSLLQAERSILKIEDRKAYEESAVECRYVGVIPLAKDWGMQAVYQIEGITNLVK